MFECEYQRFVTWRSIAHKKEEKLTAIKRSNVYQVYMHPSDVNIHVLKDKEREIYFVTSVISITPCHCHGNY